MSHEIERAADSTKQPAAGLGRNSSGPAFAPPASGLPLEDRPLTQPAPAAPLKPGPPQVPLLRRIAPVLGTVVILAIGVMIIVTSAIADNRQAVEDARRPVPSPAISVPPAVADDPAGKPQDEPDAIEFTTREGRGQLSVIEHTWLRRPGSTEVRLRVLVEIRGLDGMIDYDPAYFFAARNLADPVRAEDSFTHGDLDVGMLAPGEGARGYVTFLLPRGDVTLMMSSNAADWVTAIKIAD